MSSRKETSSCQKTDTIKTLPVPNKHLKDWPVNSTGPLNVTKQGNKYILWATCLFSMWTLLIPIADQAATTVANVLYEHVFTTYAPPATFLSDRDTNFLPIIVTELCAVFKGIKKFTLAYRPQSNSSIETKNSIVYKGLRIYFKGKDEWDTFLQGIQHALNTTSVAASRQFSPYFIVLGKECPFCHVS